MTVAEYAKLLDPVSEDKPCGDDPEYVPSFTALENSRIFGQMKSPGELVNWRDTRALALTVLESSRDLRALAYLAAAAVWTEGVVAFCDLLQIAAAWLTQFAGNVYPRVDDGPVARTNAMNNFADQMAIVDGLRRCPFVSNSQFGDYSLRDVDIANGKVMANEGEKKRGLATKELIGAAMTAAEIGALRSTFDAVQAGRKALVDINVAMKGPVVPKLGALAGEFERLSQLLKREIDKRPAAPATTGPEHLAAATPAAVPAASGAIRTREDAIRALDAVAVFFRESEPSSAVPLFIDRAKRLVGKNFLDILNDIAPESLAQVRKISGVLEEPGKNPK
jgi:type VI secretion system protein ImpA